MPDRTIGAFGEEAQQWLAAIVASSEDAIIGKTLDGTIVTWNVGAERLYGYGEDEAIGQSIAMLVPPEHPDELPQILAKLARGERIEHYETIRVRRDGSRVHVSLSISPIRDGSGRIAGAASIARDITDRVTERRRQQALLRVARRFAQETDPDALLRSLLEETRSILAVDSGVVFRWDAAQSGLVPIQATDHTPTFPLLRPGQGVAGAAIQQRRTIVVTDYGVSPYALAPVTAAGFKAVAGAPLMHEGRILGALWVGQYDARQFSERDAELLEQLATMASATLVGLEAIRLQGVLLAARTAEHEVNNRLVATRGYAELLARDASLPEHLKPKAEATVRGAASAADILRRLGDLVELRETTWGAELTTIDMELSASRATPEAAP